MQSIVRISFEISQAQRLVMIRRYQSRRAVMGEVANLRIDQHRQARVSGGKNFAKDAWRDNALVIVGNDKRVRRPNGILQ